MAHSSPYRVAAVVPNDPVLPAWKRARADVEDVPPAVLFVRGGVVIDEVAPLEVARLRVAIQIAAGGLAVAIVLLVVLATW